MSAPPDFRARIMALWADDALRRFARFLVVGFVNTLFGYAVFSALVLAGLPDQTALPIAYVIGVIWNYFTTARLVFDEKGFSRVPHYVLAYLFIYALNAAGLAGLTGAGLHPLIAQALILPFAAVLAFLLIGLALTGRLPLPGRNGAAG